MAMRSLWAAVAVVAMLAPAAAAAAGPPRGPDRREEAACDAVPDAPGSASAMLQKPAPKSRGPKSAALAESTRRTLASARARLQELSRKKASKRALSGQHASSRISPGVIRATDLGVRTALANSAVKKQRWHYSKDMDDDAQSEVTEGRGNLVENDEDDGFANEHFKKQQERFVKHKGKPTSASARKVERTAKQQEASFPKSQDEAEYGVDDEFMTIVGSGDRVGQIAADREEKDGDDEDAIDGQDDEAYANEEDDKAQMERFANHMHKPMSASSRKGERIAKQQEARSPKTYGVGQRRKNREATAAEDESDNIVVLDAPTGEMMEDNDKQSRHHYRRERAGGATTNEAEIAGAALSGYRQRATEREHASDYEAEEVVEVPEEAEVEGEEEEEEEAKEEKDDEVEESTVGVTKGARKNNKREETADEVEESTQGAMKGARKNEEREETAEEVEESTQVAMKGAGKHKKQEETDDEVEESTQGAMEGARKHKKREETADEVEESTEGAMKVGRKNKKREEMDDEVEESAEGAMNSERKNEKREEMDDELEESTEETMKGARKNKKQKEMDEEVEESTESAMRSDRENGKGYTAEDGSLEEYEVRSSPENKKKSYVEWLESSASRAHQPRVKMGLLEQDPAVGTVQPLTEEGYQVVAKTCCKYEMEEYMRRVIFKLGLELCHEGGLMGLVPYFTCDKGIQSYDALTSNILASQPPAKCAFVASPGNCPVYDDCERHPDPDAHRRRYCGSHTPGTYR